MTQRQRESVGFESLRGFNKCMHLPIRLKEEQLRKQLAQEQRQQEAKAQPVKEKAKNEEDPHRLKQEDDKRKKEEQEKELQIQVDKEVGDHCKVVQGSCFCLIAVCIQMSGDSLACCVKYVPLGLNRERKPKSRLKRMQSVSGKTENCRRNTKRRRGN